MFSFRRPGPVQGVVVEQVIAFLHDAPQHRLLGQIGADLPGQMVMGRLQRHRLAMLPDHNIPVAGAGVELKFFRVEFLPDGLHENMGILGGDLPGAVIQNGLFRVGLLLRQGHQIHPKGHILRLHGNVQAQRLQGGAAGIAHPGVIAQDGQIGNIAAGVHSLRHILHQSHLPGRCQRIQGGGMGRFQGGLSSQGLDGFIGHSVSQNHNVFHSHAPFPFCQIVRKVRTDVRI